MVCIIFLSCNFSFLSFSASTLLHRSHSSLLPVWITTVDSVIDVWPFNIQAKTASSTLTYALKNNFECVQRLLVRFFFHFECGAVYKIFHHIESSKAPKFNPSHHKKINSSKHWKNSETETTAREKKQQRPDGRKCICIRERKTRVESP